MATLKLKNINKVYPNGVQSVFDFNLDIEDKEFIVFVGPSGCGKSTTLRMIAGLEEITSGEFIINGEVVNDKSSKDRDIAMVFQSYALYPHMSVYENMAFGLRLRKKDKSLGLTNEVIDQKVKHAAEILGLTPYLDRKPKALSGGQRQRVALGRAIVRNAQVFLMDEPLSNLDAKLRVSMRSELIKLHKRLQTTTIYVTHDQIEAMTMASKIVVMSHGHIQQVGSPKEIYDNPENIFVGGFIGTPPMNFIHGKINEDGYFVASDGKKFYIPKSKLDIVKANKFIGKEIILGIRPEDIHDDNIVIETYPNSTMDYEIDVIELLGAHAHIYTYIGKDKVAASIDARYDVSIGDTIKVAFDMNKCHFFDPVSEKVLKINGNILLLEEERKQQEEKKLQEEKALQEHLEQLKETDVKQYKLEVYRLKKAEKQQLAKEKRLAKARKVKQPLSKLIWTKLTEGKPKILVEYLDLSVLEGELKELYVKKGSKLSPITTPEIIESDEGVKYQFVHWALEQTPETKFDFENTKILESIKLIPVYKVLEQGHDVSEKKKVIKNVEETPKHNEKVVSTPVQNEVHEENKAKKSCCKHDVLKNENYEQLQEEQLPTYLNHLDETSSVSSKCQCQLEKEMAKREKEVYQSVLNSCECEVKGECKDENCHPCKLDPKCVCEEDGKVCACTSDENCGCVTNCKCDENGVCECTSDENCGCVTNCKCDENGVCECTSDENCGCVTNCKCDENGVCECSTNGSCECSDEEVEVEVVYEEEQPENTVVIQNTVEEIEDEIVLEKEEKELEIIKNTTYEMKLDLKEKNNSKPLVVRNSFSKNRKENTFKKQIFDAEENKK